MGNRQTVTLETKANNFLRNKYRLVTVNFNHLEQNKNVFTNILPHSIRGVHDPTHSSPYSLPFLLVPKDRSTIYTSPNCRTTVKKNNNNNYFHYIFFLLRISFCLCNKLVDFSHPHLNFFF